MPPQIRQMVSYLKVGPDPSPNKKAMPTDQFMPRNTQHLRADICESEAHWNEQTIDILSSEANGWHAEQVPGEWAGVRWQMLAEH